MFAIVTWHYLQSSYIRTVQWSSPKYSALTKVMILNWAAFQRSHWPHVACRPQIGHVCSIVHSWCGKLPAFWQMYNDLYQSALHHTEYFPYPRNLFCVPLTTPKPAPDNCWSLHWLCGFTFQECHRNEFTQEASFKKLLLLFFTYVSECFASMYVLHHMRAWCPWGPEKGVRSLRVGAAAGAPLWVLSIEPVSWKSSWCSWLLSALSPHSRRPLRYGFLYSLSNILPKLYGLRGSLISLLALLTRPSSEYSKVFIHLGKAIWLLPSFGS